MKIILYFNILYYILCDVVEVIPDEISTIHIIEPIYDYKSENKIDLGQDLSRYKGKLYYKDPKIYYGPKERYKDVYENKDIKFLVIINNKDTYNNR
jgi:hypothetical protein